MRYREMNESQLRELHGKLLAEYEEIKAKGYKLDLSRGKPCREQCDITEGMLTVLSENDDCFTDAGFDTRNYGIVDGIPEAKKLFSDLLGIPEANILVAGNSSLNLMYDAITRAKFPPLLRRLHRRQVDAPAPVRVGLRRARDAAKGNRDRLSWLRPAPDRNLHAALKDHSVGERRGDLDGGH